MEVSSYGHEGSVPQRSSSWVQVGRLFALPRAYTAAFTTDRHPGLHFTLRVTVGDDGRAHLRSLAISCGDESGGELAPSLFREVSIPALVKISTSIAMDRGSVSKAGRLHRLPIGSKHVRDFLDDYVGVRAPRSGVPLTPEHFEQVAEVYRTAFAAGEPPTAAVAKALGAKHSTAARWVGQARKRGLLGAALGTKAGEQSVARSEVSERKESS